MWQCVPRHRTRNREGPTAELRATVTWNIELVPRCIRGPRHGRRQPWATSPPSLGTRPGHGLTLQLCTRLRKSLYINETSRELRKCLQVSSRTLKQWFYHSLLPACDRTCIIRCATVYCVSLESKLIHEYNAERLLHA